MKIRAILPVIATLGVLAIAPGASGAEPGSAPTLDAAHNAAEAEAATTYRDEAAMLQKRADSHRKIAATYRGRRSGKADFAGAAAHCDKLAKLYEEAAKEAGAVASALSK